MSRIVITLLCLTIFIAGCGPTATKGANEGKDIPVAPKKDK